MTIENLIYKIPSRKTRMYLVELYYDLMGLSETVSDGWWQYKADRIIHTKHQFITKTKKCQCGYDYGTDRDKDIRIHIDRVRELLHAKRWDYDPLPKED